LFTLLSVVYTYLFVLEGLIDFFPSNQERRIGSLDAANSRLMEALTQVKERCSSPLNGLSPSNPTKLSITENGEFKNSSC